MKRAISKDDNKKLLKKIEKARESEKLNDWEKNFLKKDGNIVQRLESNQSLSQKQDNTLNKILKKCE